MTSDAYILLVDDEPHNLLLLEDLLEMEGYQTQAVSDGETAIAIAQQQPPQVIVLDVMMPDLDGFEVCQRLRSIPTLQTVPIIFLTALDDEESRLQGLSVMGDDYLTKPIQTKLFLAKLQNSIQLNQLRSQAQRTAMANQVMQLQQASQRQMEAAWQINETLTEKFRLFVPEKFLARIAPQGVESIQLGNAMEAELTVLFCDIRSFTSIAAAQPATETFAWLNTFFTAIGQEIDRCQGYIDKYLGDAVMAIFDRPHLHVQDGLEAAISILTAVEQFNQTQHRLTLKHPVQVGIGLHTGVGVIGTLGSSQRMDSTVIGDVVNTASRLEELTKTYSAPIIVSDAVVEALGPNPPYDLRWLAQVVLRGRETTTDVYELCDRRPATAPLPPPQSPETNVPMNSDLSGSSPAIAFS